MKLLSILAFVFALPFTFAAAAPAQAADFSPALQEVIAGAKKEGKLELQWGAGMIGNNNVLKQMGEGMNAMFGTNIAVRFTPGPSEPEMLNKVMIAIASNQPSPTDIVINTNQYAGELYQQKGSVPVDWVALMPDRIKPEYVEAGGSVIRTFTTLAGRDHLQSEARAVCAEIARRSVEAGMEGQDRLDALCRGLGIADGERRLGPGEGARFRAQALEPGRGPHPLQRSRTRRLGRVHRLRSQLRRPRRYQHEGERRADRRGDPRRFRGRALLLCLAAEEFGRPECGEAFRAVPRKPGRAEADLGRHADRSAHLSRSRVSMR